MTTASSLMPLPAQPMGWLRRAEAWLDAQRQRRLDRRDGLGFIFFWPVGLALLAYMIWSKRMFSKSCRNRSQRPVRGGDRVHASSGNVAFDAYKAETLRRLEEEQASFRSLPAAPARGQGQGRVRRFMADRARAAATPGTEPARGDL
jgi:hypothetical protein